MALVGDVWSFRLEDRLALTREAVEGSENQKLGDLVDGVVFPHIHPDQGFDLALERMGANQLDILPVVSRADVHKLEGIVTLRAILDAYGVGSERI